MGGVKVPCLVDTGSMVSTVRESFFRQHFATWGQEKLQSCHWLRLQAANGLPIPYLGYLELEVELCGRTVPGCGLLVVKDPPADVSLSAPGVLGMNILRRCYSTLFGQHGSALFKLHTVTEAPKLVVQALQRCHQASLTSPADLIGKVRLRGKKACRIFGGTMQLVPPTFLGLLCYLNPRIRAFLLGCWRPQHWFECREVLCTYLLSMWALLMCCFTPVQRLVFCVRFAW